VAADLDPPASQPAVTTTRQLLLRSGSLAAGQSAVNEYDFLTMRLLRGIVRVSGTYYCTDVVAVVVITTMMEDD
jgi:hypothetical protein